MCPPAKSMPRSRRRRGNSASISSPTAATSPINARFAHPALHTSRRWIFSAAVTCSPMYRPSSARSTSCSGRWTDEPSRKFAQRRGSVMAVRRLADPALQPESFAFTTENLDWAKREITKYPTGRQHSAVIALLWRAQEQAGGWLPQKAIEHVAGFLGMAKMRALEVATFYTMFNLAPVGKFHVQLCGTTPCLLRGAGKLIELCHERIGEQLNVSADGKLSWIEVE